jgi:hypothetical protein
MSGDGERMSKTLSYMLTVILFAILAIPMVGIAIAPSTLWGHPYSLTPHDSIWYFSVVAVILSFISPWVFLSMSLFFRHKGMRIRTYAAMGLFAWAALTPMFYMIIYFITSLSPSYYFHLQSFFP